MLSKEFPQGLDLVYEGVGGRMGNIAKRLLGELVSFTWVDRWFDTFNPSNLCKVLKC